MHSPLRALAVIGAALVLMVGGAIAYAAIPSADGTITACMLKPGGTIRLVETGTACKKSEVKVEWNQAGQSGEDGADFSDQLYETSVGFGDTTPTGWRSVAECDPGDEVVGVGSSFISGQPRLISIDRLTINATGNRAMVMDLTEPFDGTFVNGSLTALCLDLTP